MRRLFEALSEMETCQPSTRGIERKLASSVVIELGSRSIAVVPSISERDAEAELASTEGTLADAATTGIAKKNHEEDVKPETLWAATIFPDVSSSDVVTIMAQQEPAPEHQSNEAILSDLLPPDMALPMVEQCVESLKACLERFLADESISDVAFPESELPTLNDPRFTGADLTSVFTCDIPQQLLERQTPQEQVSNEDILQYTSPSVIAMPNPRPEPKVEDAVPEPLRANVLASEVAAKDPELEVAPEQSSTDIISSCALLSDFALQNGPNVQTARPVPMQESTPTMDSETKSAMPAPRRPISINVPAESRLVALTDANCLGAEKFRALAARLESLQRQSDLKCFQVTSSVIHEGKSLVSGNVAITLAKYSGSKTLLIEGDMHRPTLATIFGIKTIRGLSHWWFGQDQDLDMYVHKMDNLPLWFLPAGNPCARPADVLRSARFVKAFEKLATQFEWIVVDSTPMLPIVDVNVWSRLVDGTLLVVREGVTPVQALQQGLRALDHPNLIGVVLNEATATDELKYAGQYYGSTRRK